MAKVKHPVLRGVVRSVPDKDVDAWVEQGWVRESPPRPRTRARPYQFPKTPRSATTR